MGGVSKDEDFLLMKDVGEPERILLQSSSFMIRVAETNFCVKFWKDLIARS